MHPLRRLSIDFDAEHFTAVMGPSGSGKSTLLHVLAGLDTVDEGTITLRTDDGGQRLLSGLNEEGPLTRVRRENIGFVFQSYNLVPAMTAEENILLPSSLRPPPHSGTYYDLVIDPLGLTDRLHATGPLSSPAVSSSG